MRDPLGRPTPSVVDVLLCLGGIAGVASGITMPFLGLRAVMDVGGCAVAAAGHTRERDDDALVERLERLAALRESGALTEEELARAKSELLEGAEG